jgi:hypothetical protein
MKILMDTKTTTVKKEFSLKRRMVHECLHGTKDLNLRKTVKQLIWALERWGLLVKLHVPCCKTGGIS